MGKKYTCVCCGGSFAPAEAHFELSGSWLRACQAPKALGGDEFATFLQDRFRDQSYVGEKWFQRLNSNPLQALSGVNLYCFLPQQAYKESGYNIYRGQKIFNHQVDRNGIPHLSLGKAFADNQELEQTPLCPHCHFRLPLALFQAKQVTVQRVGIIGQKSAGKTVFLLLLVLQNWLNRGGCLQGGENMLGATHPLAVNQAGGLVSMAENYRLNGQLPAQTAAAWLPPVIIQLRFPRSDGGEHLHLLALFDVAGENYQELAKAAPLAPVDRPQWVNNSLRLLAAMDSYLLLLDSKQDILGQDGPQSLTAFQWLFNNTQMFRDKPVALMLTKGDALYPNLAPQNRFSRLNRSGGLADAPHGTDVNTYASRFEEIFRLPAGLPLTSEAVHDLFALFQPEQASYDDNVFFNGEYYAQLQRFLKAWLGEKGSRYQWLCHILEEQSSRWAIFLTAALGLEPDKQNCLPAYALRSIHPADGLAWLVLNHTTHAGSWDAAQTPEDGFAELLGDGPAPTAPLSPEAPSPPTAHRFTQPDVQPFVQPFVNQPAPERPPGYVDMQQTLPFSHQQSPEQPTASADSRQSITAGWRPTRASTPAALDPFTAVEPEITTVAAPDDREDPDSTLFPQ